MSYNRDSNIEEYVKLVLEQSVTRLKKDLMNVTMLLVMESDAHVPDTLTRIRVLPSVSVVGQDAPVMRPDEGNVRLQVYVKFLPSASNTYASLKTIGKLIKGLPGIKIVKIMTVGGRKVLYRNKPIVI